MAVEATCGRVTCTVPVYWARRPGRETGCAIRSADKQHPRYWRAFAVGLSRHGSGSAKNDGFCDEEVLRHRS